jgi:hypothetical protein
MGALAFEVPVLPVGPPNTSLFLFGLRVSRIIAYSTTHPPLFTGTHGFSAAHIFANQLFGYAILGLGMLWNPRC